jgi:DnaK suppressor protein
MKKSFLKQIKQILQKQKHDILCKCQDHNQEIDTTGDEIDLIQARILAIASTSLAARDKQNLIRIENTLKRIEDGSFGECQECGDLISEQRLLISPWFITCIGCSERLERLGKQVR